MSQNRTSTGRSFNSVRDKPTSDATAGLPAPIMSDRQSQKQRAGSPEHGKFYIDDEIMNTTSNVSLFQVSKREALGCYLSEQDMIHGTLKTTVLLADHRDYQRSRLKGIINAMPACQVLAETLDGPATIAKAAQLQPTLMIISERLPLPDGSKTVQRVKKRVPEIKVIMILSRPRDFFHAVQSGADAYLLSESSKPVIEAAIYAVRVGSAWLGPRLVEFLLRGDGVKQLWRIAQSAHQVPGLDKLTAREREVLRLVSNGMSNRKIAESLGLSQETIKVHMRNVLKKLQVRSRAQAVSIVLRAGIGNPSKLNL